MRFLALLVSMGAVCADGGAASSGATQPTALLAAASGAPRAKAEGRVLSWHFVGTAQLDGNTNASSLREVLTLPASQDVLRNTLNKLASAPGAWLGVPAATNPATAGRVRPLLEAALRLESYGEVTSAATGDSAVVLAIRAGADPGGALETNWRSWVSALGAGAPSEIKVGNMATREAKLAAPAVWFRSGQAGGWVVFGLGRGSAQPFGELVGRVAGNSTTDAWLETTVSGARFAQLMGWSTPASWPDAEFKFTGRGANLRTTARLLYAQGLDLKLEPWRIPTHTINDPLVSFTVVQGIRSWLAQQPWWTQLGLPTTPNQATAWTVGEIPFASYLAWESSDITNHLRRLGPAMPAFLSNNVPKIRFGQVALQTNQTRLAWIGLPIAEPFLSPASEQDPGFMIGGLFPLVKTKAPLPSALLTQIGGRTNLVYYDWELTHERVNGWRHVKNLYWMLAGYMPPPTNHTGEAWLTDTNVIRRLGNTVTELTWTSPRELDGVRSSAVGLTGGELIMLMRWLDDPAFPRTSEPPLTPSARRRLTGKAGAAPQSMPAPTVKQPGTPPPAAPGPKH